MKPKQAFAQWIGRTPMGNRWLEDAAYRVVAKAVLGLICNFSFAFYNGILGVVSGSFIWVISAAYYLLLSAMRFVAVLLYRKKTARGEQKAAGVSLAAFICAKKEATTIDEKAESQLLGVFTKSGDYGCSINETDEFVKPAAKAKEIGEF